MSRKWQSAQTITLCNFFERMHAQLAVASFLAYKVTQTWSPMK